MSCDYGSGSYYLSKDNMDYLEGEAEKHKQANGLRRYNKSNFLDDLLTSIREQSEKKRKPKKKVAVVNEEDVILWLPCKSGKHPVTKEDVMQYIQTYPNIDLEVQLKSMYSWLDANPSKRKTANGMKRFINGWLQRESAKAPSVWSGDY